MIVTLNGKVTEKTLDTIVLDVNGVGYGLIVTTDSLNKLNLEQNVRLYVYEHIRENSYDLYGFPELEIKELFIKLINVNGVGPKVAINILGVGSVGGVRQAIASGNVKLIQTAPGVGKRVAERVVIELKDKVGLVNTVDEGSILVGEDAALQDEAVQALVALGYSVQDAVLALKPVDKDLLTSERVTLALKKR